MYSFFIVLSEQIDTIQSSPCASCNFHHHRENSSSLWSSDPTLLTAVPQSFPTWECCHVWFCTNRKNAAFVPESFAIYCDIYIVSKLSDGSFPGFTQVRADLNLCRISGNILREKI